MGLKRLRRTRRAEPKDERSTHPVQETATAEAPHHVMETSLHANVVQLQSLIGNHRVQRLLSEGYINRKTGLIQRQPDAPVTAPTLTPAAPTAVENQAPPAGEPEEIEIEQGMYLGGQELHSKALPKNQYYASHPPKPGWPYTNELKALWDAGQFNDFADEVAAYQHFTLKLPETQVDGILGPKTSRNLRGNQDGSPPPGTQTPSADPAVPSAETVTPTPTGPTTTPNEPAPDGGTTTTTTQTTTDDSAVSGHPAVARILNPVKQAFGEYKEAEKQYQAADRAVSKAKKGEKAAKEEERQSEMGKMEESRNAARAVMATAREQVAALTEAEFPGGSAEMKQVKGYLNRQLNAHTVYYAQGFNANILSGNGHTAAGRTCNMTVMSMMLEALGKSTKDYTGDLTKLQSLAGDYDEALGKNNSEPEDLTALRLPDFLQLVAIDIAGSRDRAAGSITSHAFITDVARSFGLKIVDIKGEERKDRKGEDEKSFLGTKYASKLDTIGALYRPAESDAYKDLNKDETYKNLKGGEKAAYGQQFVADFTEKRRLQYIANVDAWTDIDTQTKTQLEALQTELGQPNSTDSAKPRFFDTEFQAKADEVLKALGDISAAIPKEQSGKQKKLNKLIGQLQKAVDKDRKKSGAPPKNLSGLLSGKGSLVSDMESNLKKYENLKATYETLGKEGGAEEILPIEDYKASVIPTMQTAIDSGFQVMVNLENHFVRLQSVADDGFVIDDPGNRTGEDNKISWENGRKSGYFKHYLLVSP